MNNDVMKQLLGSDEWRIWSDYAEVIVRSDSVKCLWEREVSVCVEVILRSDSEKCLWEANEREGRERERVGEKREEALMRESEMKIWILLSEM